jgi:hypothetical protein
MATSIVKSVELDFAEFASTLISETLNAIIATAITQEKQVVELEQQAMLTPEEYARENLTDEMIRAEILRLFPSSTGKDDKSSVDIGEPYLISEGAEHPSINKKLGYTIIKEDLDDSKKGTIISKTGYNNIYAATRLALAIHQLSIFRQIINRGIPRVYVNEGHIKSKLALKFESQTSTNPTQLSPITGSKIAGVGTYRLIAQPVNATKPEILTLSADILSEVEITFKTVIP